MSDNQRGKRTPALINTAVGVVILALIIPLALLTRQNAPPAIAAFAPEARQNAKAGSGPGSQGAGGGLGGQGVAATTTTNPTTKLPPGAKQGSSATTTTLPKGPGAAQHPTQFACTNGLQIPDPHSPACVPYWSGNNGGSTYAQGVTGTQINVALSANGLFFGAPDELQDLQTYFNQHFEFYGRKLNLVSGTAACPGVCNPNTAQEQQAADADAENLKVFASTGESIGDIGQNQLYCDELARRGALCADPYPDQWTEGHLNGFAPFEWGTIPGLDRQESALGNFVCRTLKGQPPSLGGPTWPWSPAPTQRSVAVIAGASPDLGLPAPDTSILTGMLTGCGVPNITQTLTDTDLTNTFGNEVSGIINNLENSKITTVICLCPWGDLGNALKNELTWVAQTQSYYPEWVLNSFDLQDEDSQWFRANLSNFSVIPPSEIKNTFGISFENEVLPPAQEPWCINLLTVDRTFNCANNYYLSAELYESILLISAGIQEAGPDLTPQTFQQGLFGAQFPGATGGPPTYEATVGFSPSDHTEYQDVALFRYKLGRPEPYIPTEPGSFCYADGGQRFSPGGLPTSDTVFSLATCR